MSINESRVGYYASVAAGYIKYGWISLLRFFRKFQSGRHQLTSTTSYNRYPELFSASRQQFEYAETSTLKILSFGCSTGEECFTLNDYFQGSQIWGADINRINLTVARLRNKHQNIHFFYSSPEKLYRHAHYNLIFCMSVLCRWEDTKDLENCAAIYPFEKFEQTVNQLTALLKPGGLLILYNCNFRFEDTQIFSSFEVVPAPVADSGFVHKFDRNNNRLKEIHHHCIYRKISK